MRLGHAADLHLGHVRYAALTPEGRSRREQDVSDAFAAMVDQMIAAQVDLVLIAGDVFDTGRPSNAALADAVRGILRLRTELPDAPVIIVSGNHDVKSAAPGSPLDVLALVGAHVCHRAERLWIEALDCEILAVPDADIRTTALEPGERSGALQLLVAHGAFGGRLDALGVDVLSPALISPLFSYCGLGDYHEHQQVAPNAWYSGAIEFTASDAWRECGQPHGWLLADTDAATVELQPVPTRSHIDLPRVSAMDLTGAALTEQIMAGLAQVQVEGAVVRQVVTDCLIGTESAMDKRAIAQAAAGAIAFRLDVRRPTVVRAGQRELLPVPDHDTEAEQVGHAAGEDYDYDLETLLTKSLTRPAPSEAEEIAAFEAARVAQRIPLERWRAMNTVPARWYPETLDPEQEARFEAEYAARGIRAETLDAQAGEQLADEIEERRAARAQKRSAA